MMATSGVRGVSEGRKGGIEDLKKDEKDTNAPHQGDGEPPPPTEDLAHFGEDQIEMLAASTRDG